MTGHKPAEKTGAAVTRQKHHRERPCGRQQWPPYASRWDSTSTLVSFAEDRYTEIRVFSVWHNRPILSLSLPVQGAAGTDGEVRSHRNRLLKRFASHPQALWSRLKCNDPFQLKQQKVDVSTVQMCTKKWKEKSPRANTNEQIIFTNRARASIALVLLLVITPRGRVRLQHTPGSQC